MQSVLLLVWRKQSECQVHQVVNEEQAAHIDRARLVVGSISLLYTRSRPPPVAMKIQGDK